MEFIQPIVDASLARVAIESWIEDLRSPVRSARVPKRYVQPPQCKRGRVMYDSAESGPARHKHIKRFNTVLADAGIMLRQLAVLIRVEELGEPHMTQLAAALSTRDTGLAHLMRPLVRAGYLTQFDNPHNRRFRHVLVSLAGLAKIEECRVLWLANEQARAEMSSFMWQTVLNVSIHRLLEQTEPGLEPASHVLVRSERSAACSSPR